MNKGKNMNESEKILYALDILQLTTKDEKKKNELNELINALTLKMGKTLVEEETEETGNEPVQEIVEQKEGE